MNFWAIWKNITPFKYKTAVTTFWAKFGTIGLLFIPISGHTDWHHLLFLMYLLLLCSNGGPVSFSFFLSFSLHQTIISVTWLTLERTETFGREAWSSGYPRRLAFKSLWVRIPAPDTGWTFFTLYYCKNCNVCLKKTENKWKEAGSGPLKKQSFS